MVKVRFKVLEKGVDVGVDVDVLDEVEEGK